MLPCSELCDITMPTTCAAFGCTNNSKRDNWVTFHRFPSNPERRKQWLNLMNRENFCPGLHTFLCSRHFEESCFDRTGQTVRLRVNAVPTIFIYPEHMIEKIAFLKTTIIKPEEDTSPPCTTGTQTDTLCDHSYCLRSPAEIKRKIWELERKLEIAHKKIKIYQQKERRVNRKCLPQNGINPVLHERPEDMDSNEILDHHSDNKKIDPEKHNTAAWET
ncbi:THAP domain-containing protein 2-like isoform X1 [Pseudophryne corroboree]|uniref:THAP domain-containing protein 2-like isoform X1 n=1 Tax=Pseudophryne corroboree TaxID=495146 RepID=UPI00308128D3